MKKLVSLLLLVCLVLTAVPTLAEDLVPAELPEYLDVYYEGGQKFNVKDQNITLKIAAVYNETNGRDMNDAWITRYIKKHTGITLEWTMIPASAAAEQLTLLMLNQDDMPDIFWGFNMNTATMLKYGDLEGQLLDLTPYINEKTMPALNYIFSIYPEKKASITTPSGAIYCMPRLMSASLQTLNQGYLWEGWLKENGLEMPKTLDELTAVLYAFKEANPDSTPLGGAESYLDPRSYILNAFGFVNQAKGNSVGNSPAISDGKVVIPVMEDKYYDFLKLMNQYYADGIINEEFFTMSQDAVKAQFAAGETLYTGDRATYFMTGTEHPELEGVGNYVPYHSVYPLTSKWNETPAIQGPNPITVGNLCVSTSCKYPEIACALFDWVYTDEGGIYIHSSAMAGEDTLGMYEGWSWNEEKQSFFDPDTATVENGGNGRWSAFYAKNGAVANPTANLRFGNRMGPLEYIHLAANTSINAQYVLCDMPVVVPEETTWDYLTNYAANEDHVVTGFPTIVWLNDDDQMDIDDIKDALNNYIKTEVAKFIVGQRPLNETEWADFQANLKKLGIDTMVRIYTGVYEGYINALKK
ncbi:MAG: extracellular solute-binding protein [Clostridiales bacterium]|nr:extracellular solute-binding protein [Clostridiales bacterium]